ncbi:hypothetical protein D3C71_1519560 [compost metagenome]
MAQHLPARAAVHARGALDFDGQRREVAHQHPGQQRDHGGQVHDPQAEQAARQADGGKEHVVRNQQGNRGQRARSQQHIQQRTLERKFKAPQHIARQRGDGRAGGGGRQRHQCAVHKARHDGLGLPAENRV